VLPFAVNLKNNYIYLSKIYTNEWAIGDVVSICPELNRKAAPKRWNHMAGHGV